MALRKSSSEVLEDKADGGGHRAAKGMAGAAKGDGIAFALIFLGRKVETDPGGGLDVPKGC